MLKTLLTMGSLMGVLSCASVGRSQALPTAEAHSALQVGGGWTFARPDYGQKTIQGITIYGDFNFGLHVGAEAEYHYISLETPTDLGENSFLVGPRFILPRGRYSLYAKALIGVGDIAIQEVADNPQGGAGRYTAFAIGAGIDYRIKKNVVARGDYEWQHWNYLTGLTPSVFTFGAAYRFR